MHISILHEISSKPTARWMGPQFARDEWNVDIALDSEHRAYLSYADAKSLWFSLGAALSEHEDHAGLGAPWNNAPVTP